MESTSIKTSIDKGKNNCIIDNCNLIYVVNWFDYSSKFGIGYELNNGSYGVFFNDSTKIICQNGEEFCYFVEGNYNCYHINNYPKDNKDLNKKVILLNYFKKYFEEQNKNKKNNRLNNKIIQFIFNDKTEIIFVSSEKSVYFINHKGEKLKYFLKTALDSSNEQMVKRLIYAENILKIMLEKKKVENKDKSHIEEIDGFGINIKQLKTADSSEILQGEKKIVVEFISVDQTINYRSVICKNTDKFSKVENVIYEEYHGLKNGNYYFIVNGDIVDKNKSLEENKIKDKDVITIIEIEKSFFV